MPSTITNKLGYPQEIVDACTFDGYIKEGQYSPSDLFQPYQITVLKKNAHFEVDVHDLVGMLHGSAMHHIFEMAHFRNYEQGILRKAGNILERLKAKEPDLAVQAQNTLAHLEGLIGSMPEADNDILLEYSLKYELPNGFTVSGRPDKVNKATGLLQDLKNVGVSQAVSEGYKKERGQQLNFYRWLLWITGVTKVTRMELVLWYKDFAKMKSIYSPKFYPKKAIEEFEIPFSYPDENLPKIEEAVVRLVEKVDSLVQTNTLIECTLADKWQSKTMYSLWKIGNKKATKLSESREQLETQLSQMKAPAGMYFIKEVPGAPIRCLYYCPVRSVCPQRVRELGEYKEEYVEG